MHNKKAVKIGLISGLALLLAVGGIVIATRPAKNEPIKVAQKAPEKPKASEQKLKTEKVPTNPKDLDTKTPDVPLESSVTDNETLDAYQKEVETNPDGKTGTDRRMSQTETSSTAPVDEKEVAKAAKGGEYSQKVYDVKVKGVTISEEDIANARKALKDANINDGVYSDLDIAKIVKAASDKSLDIATVARDGKF